MDSLLLRLRTLKDEAEEYSEEEGKRRFETIESQANECTYHNRASDRIYEFESITGIEV